MYRLWSLAIGYLLGCILTAEPVVRHVTGQGTDRPDFGNPGMANVMAKLGVKWGLAVLAGDLLKTCAACLASCLLFPAAPRLKILYAGTGAVLGHNFPFWRRFRGGKGVAATCAAIVLYTPLRGAISCLIGLAAMLLSGYLPLGAVAIPACYAISCFFRGGKEETLLALALALMMFLRHRQGLARVMKGEEKKFGRPAKQ